MISAAPEFTCSSSASLIRGVLNRLGRSRSDVNASGDEAGAAAELGLAAVLPKNDFGSSFIPEAGCTLGVWSMFFGMVRRPKKWISGVCLAALTTLLACIVLIIGIDGSR